MGPIALSSQPTGRRPIRSPKWPKAIAPIGRKSTLVFSLMLMGGATLAIAFLPTYQAIGWLAPALLCVLRFAQRFGLSGEWSGAALLVVGVGAWSLQGQGGGTTASTRSAAPSTGDAGTGRSDGVQVRAPVAAAPAPSTAPQEQVRDALGSLILVDGIPCTDFLPAEPIEGLVENTRKCIEYFAPRLVLGISDEISPVGDIERVRLVTRLCAEHDGRA